MLSRVAVCFVLAAVAAGSRTVLVTGATGQTGLLVYKMLKEQGVSTRAFVRNVSKARALLNCTECDASEGIFEGDVTKPETMIAAMEGITALAIATSAIPHCADFHDLKTCSYPKGGYPVDVDFNGGKAQIEAFAKGRVGNAGPIVLCSSMGTTDPDGFLEQLGHGHIGFYKLNEESVLMSSGLPFTIVKPCGLTNDAGGQRLLVVGHDDQLHENPPVISRADVANVIVEALLNPQRASGLRFDLCSKAGNPSTHIGKVFEDAQYPWQKPLILYA